MQDGIGMFDQLRNGKGRSAKEHDHQSRPASRLADRPGQFQKESALALGKLDGFSVAFVIAFDGIPLLAFEVGREAEAADDGIAFDGFEGGPVRRVRSRTVEQTTLAVIEPHPFGNAPSEALQWRADGTIERRVVSQHRLHAGRQRTSEQDAAAVLPKGKTLPPVLQEHEGLRRGIEGQSAVRIATHH